jgi:hypothetical protein
LRAAWVILCALFVVLSYRSADSSIIFMRASAAHARLAHAAVRFSRLISSPNILRAIYPPDPNAPAQLGVALDDAQLLRPPLLRSAIITPSESADECAGKMETRFSGWAVLLKKKRPADGVLLAYETDAREWRAFSIAEQLTTRFDIVTQFHNQDVFWSGWSAAPSLENVLAGATISAWAFDAENGKTYRLESAF